VRDSRYEMLAADLRGHFNRGLGEETAAGPTTAAKRMDRQWEMRIIGMLRHAPDLVDEGEYHNVPWVLLPRAEHHKLMDDLYELATALLGSGVLPRRSPGTVVLARAGAAVRRLFRPTTRVVDPNLVPLLQTTDVDGGMHASMLSTEEPVKSRSFCKRGLLW
jgi:hypothetical protein